MAKIVSEPQPKRVDCGSCHATIEYLPEEVERHTTRDYTGTSDTEHRVKCPRSGCPGYGYVRSW